MDLHASLRGFGSRSFAGPSTPDEDGASGSPLVRATCDGDAITQQEALEFFPAGTDTTPFAAGEWHHRERACNELTGCGEWDETQGSSTASTTLNVRGGRIYLGLSATPISARSISCAATPVTGARTSCSATDYSYRSHTFNGRVTNSCTRLDRVVTDNTNSSGDYRQRQWVYLQTY